MFNRKVCFSDFAAPDHLQVLSHSRTTSRSSCVSPDIEIRRLFAERKLTDCCKGKLLNSMRLSILHNLSFRDLLIHIPTKIVSDTVIKVRVASISLLLEASFLPCCTWWRCYSLLSLHGCARQNKVIFPLALARYSAPANLFFIS
jgi:hypothetical protein